MERNVIKKSCIHSPNGSTSQEGLVDKLPVELIGEILSRVGVARDVIRASLTCCKWREAYRKHLHTLSFDVADDYRVYRQLRTSDLEMLITRTIFQAPGLRKLKILMDDEHVFSAVAVVGWLTFSRDTLSRLFYKVRTSPSINVLDICARRKLETLSLYQCTIRGVEPNFQRFSCLTSLSLISVRISSEDLNRLLMALPELEHLELTELDSGDVVDEFDREKSTVVFHCPTLKSLFINVLDEFEFILEGGEIEYLHLQCCTFCSFKVVGSKSLRQFKISNSEFRLLEIAEGDNLESFEIITSHVFHSNLFPLKVKAPKLRTFRIWGFMKKTVSFPGEDKIILDDSEFVVDLERMAVCSPQLSHLSLFFDEGMEGVKYKFRGLSSLENVVILDVGWDHFHGFTEWTESVLKCCPNVRKLIVHGMVLERNDPKYLKDFAEHTSSIFEMMRKYLHIEVKSVYMCQTEFRPYR